MAQTVRAVGWSLRSLRLQDFFHSSLSLTTVTSVIPAATSAQQLSFLPLPPSRRCVHFKSRGLRRPVISTEPHVDVGGKISDREEDGESKKSRNEKKREARRAFRWGMELASFSAPQIKRIVRVASLEQEVFDALMLAKKLGTDVREGKRRQFNYIGKLLRDAEPELLGSLIQATKDGDYSVIETLAARKGDEEEDIYESEPEQENEDLNPDVQDTIVQRWFDGLVNRDIQISNQVYSLRSVEFDRQELRKLVRNVHSLQNRSDNLEVSQEKLNAELRKAEKSLTRFLRLVARQIPAEQHYATIQER